MKKGTEKKEKEKEERCRGCCGGYKKGSYRGRGEGNQKSLSLAQTLGGENDNAMVPKVQELSYSAGDDDDTSEYFGSGNGNRSN